MLVYYILGCRGGDWGGTPLPKELEELEGGDSHPDPQIRGPGLQKTFFWPFGPQFGLKIKGGGMPVPLGPSPGSATVSGRHSLSLHPKSNLKVTLDSSGNWYTILTCGPLRLRSLRPVQFSTCLRPGPPGRSDGGALPLLAPRCQSAEESLLVS